MRAASNFRKNKLLASLPDEEFERWHPHLEPFEFTLGLVLYESGIVLSHVYFPTTAIVSLLNVMKDGSSAEVAVVGNEGLSEFPCSWGASRRPVARLCRAPEVGSG